MIKYKKNRLATVLLSSSMTASAQGKEDSLQFSSISGEMLNHGKAYTGLRELIKTVGHRLSGSASYEKAVQ